MGRGVHMGWSEAGTFVFRVFLVQGCPVLNLLGKPWSACLRRWALARALAGAGRGSDAGVLRVTQSLGWRALLYFRLQALRTCDASQAFPRASKRSPSGSTGLETNVSASVLL